MFGAENAWKGYEDKQYKTDLPHLFRYMHDKWWEVELHEPTVDGLKSLN